MQSCSEALLSVWQPQITYRPQTSDERELMQTHCAILSYSPIVWAQEQKKSSKLEESMKMLDYEMKKTDDLLYRMIPKPVAKRLRKGEPAVNTCEVRIVEYMSPD